MKWDGIGGKKNPKYLFDKSENLAHGGVRRSVAVHDGGIAAAVGIGTDLGSGLVDRFFPQAVLDDFQTDEPGGTPTKQTAFVAADLNHTGSPDFLVAVYAVDNIRTMALVRVLHKEGGSAVLAVPDCADCDLIGRSPAIRQIDVDRTGGPQFLVEVTASQYARPTQAVFRWNGTSLELIGPFDTDLKGSRYLCSRGGEFVDLDGDGAGGHHSSRCQQLRPRGGQGASPIHRL